MTPSQTHRSEPHRPTRRNLTWMLPALVSLVLTANCYRIPYLFDDYDFLARAQTFRLGQFLPDPSTVIWRPLSRELYFGILYGIGAAGPLWGHAVNALLLGIAVVLVVRLVSSLSGPRAGFLSGIALAAHAQSPLLVAWISGIQDLMAIVFMLAAYLFRLARRSALALIAFVCALLSKETALAAAPVLIAFDWLLGRRPVHLRRHAIAYGCLLLVWAAVHPGIRLLLVRGLEGTPGGYVSLDNPERASAFGKSAQALLNLPLSGLATAWPGELTPTFAIALSLALVGLWWVFRKAGATEPGRSVPGLRPLVFGALLTLLPTLITSGLVRHWVPHYTCIPALGAAILFGVALGRAQAVLASAAVFGFLALGIWARNADVDPGIPTERTLRPAAYALGRVERGFKALRPSTTAGARVCVSVQIGGASSVYLHMYRFQVLRTWYRDPTMVTLRPDQRRAGSGPEYLFWIAPTLDVFEIDPVTLRHRPRGGPENLDQYSKTLRYYAQGLAATGEADRAADILIRLPERDPVLNNLDRRYAAMLLLSVGRAQQAELVLAGVGPLSRETRLAILSVILGYSPRGRAMDEFALRAFDFAADDVDVHRELMRRLESRRAYDPARRFAERVLARSPADSGAASVLRRLQHLPVKERITVPASDGSVL